MNADQKNNNLLYAAIMQICATAAGMLLNTFAVTVFLGNFSPTLLPYFFIVSSCVSGLAVLVLLPLLNKTAIRPAWIVQLTGILLIILFIILNFWSTKSTLFIFTFIFMLIGVVYNAIAWNVSGAAFELRTFKIYANRFILYSTFGCIVTGFLSYVSVDLFGHQSLSFIILFFLSVGTYALSKIEVVNIIEKKRLTHVPLRKYNLFLVLAAIMFLINIIVTFTKYQMLFHLSKDFHANEIAKFMTIFYLVLELMIFGMQTTANYVLEKAGLTGLFLLFVIFIFIFLIPVFLFQTLLMAVIFTGCLQAMYHSLINLGRQISLNALPAAVKNKAQLLLKSSINKLGVVIGGVVIMFFGYRYQFYSYQLLIGIAAVAILYLSLLLKKYYGETLLEIIRDKRFYLPLADFEFDKTFLKQQVRKLLATSDPIQVHMGLSLMAMEKPEKIPKEIFHLFDIEDAYIRARVYKTLKDYPNLYIDDVLEIQLQKETDLHSRWHLLNLILEKHPERILAKAKNYLTATSPDFQAIAVIALAKHGDLEDVREAINTIEKMVLSVFDDTRLFAARALSLVNLGNPSNTLKRLIMDKHSFVRRYAIRSSVILHDKSIISVLIDQLGKPGTTYEVIHALQSFKTGIILPLYKACLHADVHRYKPLLRTLCQMQSPLTDKALSRLLGKLPLLFSVELAKQIAIRASKQPLSERLRQTILVEINHTIIALEQYTEMFHTEKNEFKKHELFLRKQIVEKKLICYLAAITNPKIIMDILPKLASQQNNRQEKAEQALALEYLDLLIKDRTLAKHVFATIEERISTLIDETAGNVLDEDAWIKQVMAYNPEKIYTFNEGIAMDTMEKMIVLRKTQCFNKLPAELLLSIAEECEEKEMIAGEVIFQEGELPEGMYILESGEVALMHADKPFKTLKEYEIFGLFAMGDAEENPITAVVNKMAVMLVLQRNTLDRLVDDYPDILKEIIKYLLATYSSVLKTYVP